MSRVGARIRALFFELLNQAAAANAAFNQAQNALDLSSVLDAPGLVTPEGREQSRDTLDKLSGLLGHHRQVYATFAAQAVNRMSEAVSELPDARAEVAGMMAMLQRNVAEQLAFYAEREEWIALARKLGEMFEVGQCGLHDGELLAIDDVVLARVQQVTARLDEIHAIEVSRFERQKRKLAGVLPSSG